MAYRVENFSSKRGPDLQKDIKEWIEGMSSIEIESISIWFDSVRNLHFATIIYTSYIYQ